MRLTNVKICWSLLRLVSPEKYLPVSFLEVVDLGLLRFWSWPEEKFSGVGGRLITL